VNNSYLVCCACGLALFASCSSPFDGYRGSVFLAGSAPVSGGHCESSAMLNALLYEGYAVTESMITGGGGALDFSLTKGMFPFIGARNLDMRERFFAASGIEWHKVIPTGNDAGWAEIDGLLRKGVPVVLRVDMRYLPYLYGGKYGPAHMSFGWHIITLFGVDYDKGLAYVSDTANVGLQTIRLRDLAKARTSTTKNLTPHAEYYWADPAGSPYSAANKLDADSLARASFEAVLGNYENGALENLSRFGGDLRSLERDGAKPFLLPAILEYMAGTIEDYGTGGASFRILYRGFLEYAAKESSFRGSADLIPLIDDSISQWHRLAGAFRDSAKRIKGMNEASRATEYEKLGKIADSLCESEKRFYTALRIMYRGA
jgi:hypothetical protein